MESGFLQRSLQVGKKVQQDFYPCFNGIRVLTKLRTVHSNEGDGVSILVLMESGFLLTYDKIKWQMPELVSILVLMESGFLHMFLCPDIPFEELFLSLF